MEQSEYEWMYKLEDTHWWFVSRQQLVNTLLEQQLTPGSNGFMLDVGCGTGGNLKLLGRWGNTIGIDLNPVALNYARRRNLPRLAQASGLTLPYPNNVFGLVTAFDVLYHCWITDDCQAIEECYRVLQPGGWLLLTDPALPGLWSTHDEVYYTRERYLLSDIRQKLADAGFEPCLCSYTNMLLLPIFTAIRLVSRCFPSTRKVDQQPLPVWLNQWLINIRHLETRWLRRGSTLPLGSSLICLAQKISDKLSNS
jgi:SAM-dependent methyltransferase